MNRQVPTRFVDINKCNERSNRNMIFSTNNSVTHRRLSAKKKKKVVIEENVLHTQLLLY